MIAFLLAAGNSKRFRKQDKLLLPLSGKPLFQWSLEVFLRHPLVKEVFLIINAVNAGKIKSIVETLKGKKKIRIILGGKTRQESVWKGLCAAVSKKPDFALIHNAANPFVTEEEISRCHYFLQKNRVVDGIGVGRKVNDTIKAATPSGNIKQTLDRTHLWRMETPQAVRFKPFFAAHQKARKAKIETTDDLAILEWHGKKTAVIEASPNNFKITAPLDYELAKIVAGDFPRNVRVGIAEDTHIFSREHRGLHLGGILFPQFPKLKADSDGDVLLHALAAAIAQALGKGSLGTFANTLYKKGIRDSRKYLNIVLRKMKRKKLSIQHAGIHFCGSTPKIDPLASLIKKHLSSLLTIPEGNIGITAETGENRGEKPPRLRCVTTVTLSSSP